MPLVVVVQKRAFDYFTYVELIYEIVRTIYICMEPLWVMCTHAIKILLLAEK